MSTPLTVARGALPDYRYLNPDVDDMMALGIQSLIHYNGLILNDRLRPDQYKVNSIDGIGAPEIRDNRQPRPTSHGEIAYPAFWGGDTFTIEGMIYAGNLAQATRMERDLRAAFGTLVEAPMKFSWWDVHDEFSDLDTSYSMWGSLQQHPTFAGDGTMRLVYGSSSVTNPAIIYYALRQYVDHSITEKFVMTTTSNALITLPYAGVIAKCSAVDTYLFATANPTTLTVGMNVGGVLTTLGTDSTMFLSSSQQYWIKLQIIGDAIEANVYDVDPRLNDSAVALTTVAVELSGAAADQFGYTQQGYAGIYVGGQNAALIPIEDFRVDAIWPCDMVTNVRSVAAPLIKHNTQTANLSRFAREFQLTVRAGNPRIVQPTQQTATTSVLTTSTQVPFGRIYPRIYPLKYPVPIDSSGFEITVGAASAPVAVCVNRGTWLAEPIITFYGGVSFPVLINLETNDFILLDGAIADGDVVIVDVANQTMRNSAGSNVFSLWDPSSIWLNVPPGISRFLLAGQQPIGSPKVSIAWRNTWK